MIPVNLPYRHIRKLTELIKEDTSSTFSSIEDLISTLNTGKDESISNLEKILLVTKNLFLLGAFKSARNKLVHSSSFKDKNIEDSKSYSKAIELLFGSILINLETLAHLSEIDPKPKKTCDDSWKSLFGAWNDTNDNLAEEIRNSRLDNRDVPSFE